MNVTAPPQIRLTQLHIGGAFVDALDGSTFEVFNPATGGLLARVAEGAAADVDRAVAAAGEAAEVWGRMDAFERLRLLRRAGEVLRERSDELALVESLDTGKPLDGDPCVSGHHGGVPRVLRRDGALRALGRHPDDHGIPELHAPATVRRGRRDHALELSTAVLRRQVRSDPRRGNTVILKPAEQTPLTALLFAEACRDAGLPDGVVNVVTGMGPTAGRAIVEHAGVGMRASPARQMSAGRSRPRPGRELKPVVLELGGKSPNIVFADADLEQASTTALYIIAYNQGQGVLRGHQTPRGGGRSR